MNVDFTDQMVRRLDIEAQRCGVTRQALIKMWIADRLGGEPEAGGGRRFLNAILHSLLTDPCDGPSPLPPFS